MSSARPRLFIGSSTESLGYANAIHEHLEKVADIMPWPVAFSRDNGKSTLESLLKLAKDFDFAIFVFGEDDVCEHRGRRYLIARDNVLFELGLFLGKLHKDCVFYLLPETDGTLISFHKPSDLAGLIDLSYNPNNALGPRSSVSVPCNIIKEQIADWVTNRHKYLVITESPSHSSTLDTLANELLTLVEAKTKVRYLGSYPGFFSEFLEPKIAMAKRKIEIACDFPDYGSFSANGTWQKYHRLLKEKGSIVDLIVLNEKRRKRFLERQTASTPAEWQTLTAQPGFVDCLKALEERISKTVSSPEDLTRVAIKHQNGAIKQLVPSLAFFAEIDALMTIYLWIIDDEAIFSIPAFGFGQYAIEHAFHTADPTFIVALRSVWNRYKESSSPFSKA